MILRNWRFKINNYKVILDYTYNIKDKDIYKTESELIDECIIFQNEVKDVEVLELNRNNIILRLTCLVCSGDKKEARKYVVNNCIVPNINSDYEIIDIHEND